MKQSPSIGGVDHSADVVEWWRWLVGPPLPRLPLYQPSFFLMPSSSFPIPPSLLTLSLFLSLSPSSQTLVFILASPNGLRRFNCRRWVSLLFTPFCSHSDHFFQILSLYCISFKKSALPMVLSPFVLHLSIHGKFRVTFVWCVIVCCLRNMLTLVPFWCEPI